MRKLSILLALLTFSCASQSNLTATRQQKLDSFNTAQNEEKEIWASSTPPSVMAAVKKFSDHEKLPNGLTYGDSVRDLDLTGKSLAEVEPVLTRRKCKKITDVLRDPNFNQPALCNNKKVPQIIFDCPDGGVVRLKAEGDPCNKFRPQPHAVKAVRDPYNASTGSFAKEAFKVDRDDNAIPKSPAMLKPGLDADGWAEDAHVDLKR